MRQCGVLVEVCYLDNGGSGPHHCGEARHRFRCPRGAWQVQVLIEDLTVLLELRRNERGCLATIFLSVLGSSPAIPDIYGAGEPIPVVKAMGKFH